MQLVIRQDGETLTYILIREKKRAQTFTQKISFEKLQRLSEKLFSTVFSGLNSLLQFHAEKTASELLPDKLKEFLFFDTIENMRLDIDLALDFFPWELLGYKGKLLGLHKPIGRVHRIDRVTSPFNRDNSKKVVIISEHHQSLVETANYLYKYLNKMKWQANLIIEKNSRTLKKTDSTEIIHFLGYELGDSKFKSSLYERGPMLSQMVWIDSCRSSEPMNYLKIMERFGARHVIGNIGFVPEDRAAEKMFVIPEKFYTFIAEGFTVGQSLQKAKIFSHNLGETDWAWISLWGEPDYKYRQIATNYKPNKFV